MTEQEWLTSSDPMRMLDFLRMSVRGVTYDNPTIESGVPLVSDRKLRLFITAVERKWWDAAAGVSQKRSLALMEAFADSQISWHDAVREIRFSYILSHRPIEDALGCVRIHDSKGDPPKWAALIRDIFGNPFRPVNIMECPACQGYGLIDPETKKGFAEGYQCEHCRGFGHIRPRWLTWNDRLIPRMAQTIYRDHTFDQMPILADALEEAGCTDKTILDHCRNKPVEINTGPGDYGDEWISVPCGPHVRGCWVLDSIRGES